jgi:hypothetical protein
MKSYGLKCALLVCLAATGVAQDAKEIYGEDDRRDMFEVTDPFIRQLANAVPALMYAEDLVYNGNGAYTILPKVNALESPNGDQQWLPCPDEPFSNQPYAAFCSAFLVDDDLIATAGHCSIDLELEDMRVVFGWEMIDADTWVTEVPADNVYFVEEALGEVLNPFKDHAVLRLDRAVNVPGVEPLDVRRRGKVTNNALVGVIGYPMGLPKKVAFGPDTRVYGNLRPWFFKANFDASGGNSGSPVFDQETGVVEGIYVSSRVEDFILDIDCFRVNQVANFQANQGVIRSTNFAHLLPDGPLVAKQLPVCGVTPVEISGSRLSDGALILFTAILLILGSRRRTA